MTSIVLASSILVGPAAPASTIFRLSAAAGAEKFVKPRPEIVTESPGPKSVTTVRTSVLPPSS